MVEALTDSLALDIGALATNDEEASETCQARVANTLHPLAEEAAADTAVEDLITGAEALAPLLHCLLRVEPTMTDNSRRDLRGY